MTTHSPTGQHIGYARVSTLDQNLDRQLEKLAHCDRIFTEKQTGKNRRERDQLDAMLTYVRQGDTVTVTSMDRLARSVIDLSTIVQELTAKGVAIEFLQEGLTFTPGHADPYSIFQLQLIGAVAQLERSLIRERQAEGIAAAKKRGAYRGRKPSLTQIDIDRIRTLIESGVPKAEVARRENISRSTLYRHI